MNDLTVVVPNWGPLSLDMQAETGCRYAAFVTLGGQPLYRHLIAQYATYAGTIRFVFVLASDAPDIELEHLEHNRHFDVVRLSASASIGETVSHAVAPQTQMQHLVVQMADTLLTIEDLPRGDAIYVQERNDLYRWTSVIADTQGRVSVLSDRADIAAPDSQSVCVGLFSFHDGALFLETLRQALADDPTSREPFFRAIEQYSHRRAVQLHPIEHWFDCGHVDTYYESRLGYQNLRHFNTLRYEANKGQVTKTSQSTTAFRNQVRWYRQMPDDLAAYLPRIFSSSDGSEPHITMELLSTPTLGELFTDQRLPLGAWNGVVRTIAHIRFRFDEMATPSDLAAQLAHRVYVEKTRERLAHFLSQQPAAGTWWIEHNGRRWTITSVLATLDRFVQRTGLVQLDRLTPIHGDFCFSNLFYDAKVRVLKMIDPRGEFGVPGIFGDHRYDLAKLAHSYSGGYDFIVADRFSARVDEKEKVWVNIRTTEYHKKVRRIFEALLLHDERLQKEIDAIQALLFLSMLPLHADKPSRQTAMLATGLTLYAEVWEGAETI